MSFERRRRAILRTALELERDLFAAENRYLADLRVGLEDVRNEMVQRLALVTQDWERHQVESLLAEIERQMQFWQTRATSTLNEAVTAADAMGAQYPQDILRAGGSKIAVRPMLNNAQLAAFFAYDAGLVRGVSDKARNDITGLIRRAALGADSPFDVMQKMGTVTGKGAFATAFHRAEAIVRTEMGRAYSTADLATMKQSAQYAPGLKKKWLSIIDGRVRPEHADAHDQVRELDKPFNVGGEELQHPHDPNGSARNTVNCRCKAVPWDPAWEALDGKSTILGPLSLDDVRGFDRKVDELARTAPAIRTRRSLFNQYQDRTYKGETALRIAMDFDDRMRDHEWPVPMNPGFWRSTESFTDQQLSKIAESPQAWVNFFRERYGIEVVLGGGIDRYPFYDDPDLMGFDHRFSVLKGVEMYRALDPSLVVENPHFRQLTITTGDDLGLGTLGDAIAWGEIRLAVDVLDDAKGNTRVDSNTVPRIHDDNVTLEAVVHEIGHLVAYRMGQPMTFPYAADHALTDDAWKEFRVLHADSASVQSAQRTWPGLFAQLSSAKQHRAELERLNPWLLEREPANEAEQFIRNDWDANHFIEQDLRVRLARIEERKAGEPYPTGYAGSDLSEDVAETLTMALIAPERLRSDFPRRYSWVSKWLPKLVPET